MVATPPPPPATPHPPKGHAQELRVRVVSFLLLALAVTVTLVTTSLYIKWQDAVEAEQRQNANLAKVVQEQTLRVLSTVDQATLRMADVVNHGQFSEQDYVRFANETGLVPDILTQLSLVGADGRFVGSNLDPTGEKTNHVDLSEREHIRVHLEPTKAGTATQQMSASGLFVGKPVLGKVSGKWTIQLSRAIRDSSGYLHGVVVASLNPNYFEQVYSEVDIGDQGSVLLLGNDYVVRTRVAGGKPDDMGRTLELAADHPLHQLDLSSGNYQRVSSVDGVPRIAAFRRVKGYPMSVVISTTKTAALADWRSMRNLAVIFAGLFCLALTVSGLGFLNGVRQLERKNEALAISEAQAQSASQAKSEFLAAVSHELRTPLTSIRGFAELMERRLEQPSYREAAGLIRKAAEHLNALLSEILDLAKVEAGAMPIVLGDHSVREVVQTTADFFAISAAQKGLTLEVAVADSTPDILRCDGLRLKQILNNLLSNAFKFTVEGGIRLEVDAGDEQVQFHVVDTGPGIPPHLQELIFEKFRQGDANVSTQHGGTGLGLALSRALAHLMGGTLTLQSTVGEGSRFTLTLPRTAPELAGGEPQEV